MKLERIEQLDALRARVRAWRRAEDRIAFVPTMGNLHAGHLSLVAAACAPDTRVVSSVFVNPLQFGPGEDLAAYPRTLERDCELLDEAGCDLLFTPDAQTMYPNGMESHTKVEVPGLSDILCGASRPGHFTGVATVVCKLFGMVQPDLAVFGEKDFQQLLVIRRMVADLALPVEIRGMATVREADGLAMSSRNGYLSPDERTRAPALYTALLSAGEQLRAGAPAPRIEQNAVSALAAAGFTPDYFTIRRADDLAVPQAGDRDLVILTAAHLGRTRLIDNLRVVP